MTISAITPWAVVDSNNCAGNAGPHAMFLQVRVTNNTAGTLAGLSATLDGFPAAPGTPSSPPTAFTLAAGESADRYLGSIAPGGRADLYWFVNYPCTLPPAAGASIGYTVTVRDTAPSAVTSPALALTTRSEISANAGGDVLSAAIGAGAVVGQILKVTIDYRFGNPASGADLMIQPAGNPSFEAGRFRLIAADITSTTFTTGPTTAADNQLYFASVNGPSQNSMTVDYYFLALATGASSTINPFADLKSGGQVKYTGNYGTCTNNPCDRSLPPPADPFAVTKSAAPTSLPSGGTVTYSVTVTNTSAFDASIDAFRDTLPAGVTYQGFGPGSDVTAANSSEVPALGASGTIVFRAAAGTPPPASSRRYYVPANASITLVYLANVPGSPGTYANSAVAVSGSLTIGPATADVRVGPTPTGTAAPIATATATASATASETATPVPTATETAAPTATDTAVPSATATASETATPVPTATETPAPTATDTAVPSATATETETAVPTATDTAVPSATATASETATSVPTATETAAPTATDTAVASATATETETAVPTVTDTAVPSATATGTETAVWSATATPPPTATDTAPATAPSTASATPTPTEAATASPTPTPTPIGTTTCGDGVVDPGEECDQGAANSDTVPDACRSNCRLAGCGDGVEDTAVADYVFVIETSLSMRSDVKRLPTAIGSFPEMAAAAGVDSRVSLVRFGTGRLRQGPDVPDLMLDFTTSGAAFRATLGELRDRLTGPTESGTEALDFALDTVSLRPGAIPVFVVFTDEDDDLPVLVEPGRRREPPPRWLADPRAAQFQARIDAVAQRLIATAARTVLFLKPRNRPSESQYGAPRLAQVDAQNRLDRRQTLVALAAEQLDRSLQGQLLAAGRCDAGRCAEGSIGDLCADDGDCGLYSRAYDIKSARRKRTRDQFYAALLAELIDLGRCQP